MNVLPGGSIHTVQNAVDILCSTKDPHAMTEFINSVDQDYYSMTFDSGRYEIENLAGPRCRELSKMKLRLLNLDKQNKAVSRRVSELVLEKYPRYEAELQGVISLQEDNWETLVMCRQIRHALKTADQSLTYSRFVILHNHRRKLRLQQILNVLTAIRSLQNNIHQLEDLLNEGDFYAAIQLHRKSLILQEDYRSYRCIEPIQIKLKALGGCIDDKLDSELLISCEQFDEKTYATIQRAFELLGSTQTTFAQLQMHYVAAIQRRTLALVQYYIRADSPANFTKWNNRHSELGMVSQKPGGTNTIGQNFDESYAELCKRLPHSSLLSCLRAVCQSMWIILLCYHRTILWHKDRASGKISQSVSSTTCSQTNSSESGHPITVLNANTHTNDDNSSMLNGTHLNQHGCDPQLARQWHEYVVCKLDGTRRRIWSEIVSRVEPIWNVIGQTVSNETSFDEIASLLKTVNHLLHIGEEFSDCSASELLELLRASIQKFFKDFHRKHMERLRMFLEHETWELCPVKSTFTVMDLQEFRPMKDLFEQTNIRKQYSKIVNNSLTSTMHKKSTGRQFFRQPYTFVQFTSHSSDYNWASLDTQSSDVRAASPFVDPQKLTTPTSLNQRGPIFSATTLEVLRLIGRYMQMMRLLQSISGEVMHCICQVFDYYLYAIVCMFGPSKFLNSNDLPERLKAALKRINERLIILKSNSSTTLKADRFPLPDREPMDLSDSIDPSMGNDEAEATILSENTLTQYLQSYFVSIESVIALADTLETVVLPYLTVCLPDSKQGLTIVFREQSLMAARQLREPCAMALAPKLLSILLPRFITDASNRVPQHNVTASVTPTTGASSIGNSFCKMWPMNSGSAQPALNNASGVETTDCGDILFLCLSQLNWSTKEVANSPNQYVNLLHTQVISPLGIVVQKIGQNLGLTKHIINIVWSALLACLALNWLDAFSKIHTCSEEGRSQMLLDVQSLAVLAESASGIRPFPKLDYVIEYIQAFYVPVHEWEHWLGTSGSKYTRPQLTGLASCIARSNKKLHQRLLNAVNQIYNQSGSSQSTVNSGIVSGSNSNG